MIIAAADTGEFVASPFAQYGILGLLAFVFVIAMKLLYGRGQSYDRLENSWRHYANQIREDAANDLRRAREDHARDLELMEQRCARDLSHARQEARTARQEAEAARREATAAMAELRELKRSGGVDLRRYPLRSERQQEDP